MKALELLHQCACYLEILPASMHGGPEVRIVASYVSNAPGSDLKACEESVSTLWPNKEGLPFEGAVYGLLMRGDAVLSRKWWKQEVYELP